MIVTGILKCYAISGDNVYLRVQPTDTPEPSGDLENVFMWRFSDIGSVLIRQSAWLSMLRMALEHSFEIQVYTDSDDSAIVTSLRIDNHS